MSIVSSHGLNDVPQKFYIEASAKTHHRTSDRSPLKTIENLVEHRKVQVPMRSQDLDVAPRAVACDMLHGENNLSLRSLHKEIFDAPGSAPLPLVRCEASSHPDTPPVKERRTWGPLHEAIAVGDTVPKFARHSFPQTSPQLHTTPATRQLDSLHATPASYHAYSLQASPMSYHDVASQATPVCYHDIASHDTSPSNSLPDSSASDLSCRFADLEKELDLGIGFPMSDELEIEDPTPERMSRKDKQRPSLLACGYRDSPAQSKLKTNRMTEPMAEPLLPDSGQATLQCIISPRAHAVLTDNGQAPDGIGILARLEKEVRRRAFHQWDATGSTSCTDNWLNAERSLLKTVEVSRSDSQRICELEAALYAKESELRAQADRILELETALQAK